MSNAASLGFTDVLFQVRGEADAYYQSNFEPRSDRLGGSWDPLQTAVNAAHSNGLKLHAWINTMPIWRGTALPSDSSHSFYNSDPSFRRQNLSGAYEHPSDATPYPVNGEYASANPILPEVHTHIGNVVTDIASNYAVDGVHLDYIRWIGDQSFDTLPHDSQSHSLFNAETGLDPTNSANAGAYSNFIKSRITDLVGSLKSAIDSVESSQNRTIDLSAAVWRDPDIAESDRLQDYRTWLEGDLLDIAMPMMYLYDQTDHLFMPNLTNTLNINTNTRIAPGLGVYLHDANRGGVDLTIEQLQRLYDNGADGAAIYSYSSLFGSDPLASERRAAIQDFYESLPDDNIGGLSPDSDVLADFELDEGTFNLSPMASGSTLGVEAATADRTDLESHLGNYSQRLSIDGSGSEEWLVRHLSGGGDPAGNTALETQGYLGFWLKTETSGIRVAPVIDDPGTGERGLEKLIQADGQWHLYEWNLADDSQWNGWVTGSGTIDGEFTTLDSIQFFGVGDAEIYLDTIAHNPNGSLLAPLLPGDYNGDGSVNLADYTVWRDTLGATGTGLAADGNGDNVVDADDYSVWKERFGQSLPADTASIGTTTVPEPAAVVLLNAGLLALIRLNRKRIGLAA